MEIRECQNDPKLSIFSQLYLLVAILQKLSKVIQKISFFYRDPVRIIWFSFSTDSENTWREGRAERGDITPGFVKTPPSGNFSHPHPWLPNGLWEEVLLRIRPSQVASTILPSVNFPPLIGQYTPICALIGWSQLRMSSQWRKDNAGKRTLLITTQPLIATRTRGEGGRRMIVAFQLILKSVIVAARDFGKHEKWKYF